ncbi:MAG: chemotaxis protein MotA [Sphingomonadales bacterium]|nr:chemotaxis protein MotA [Sphingomonadales bacterium]MBU3991079.1 MotA/TolQ/ExbB proton channel family protein [Alphaproteobacteria bacterium]
MPLTLIDGSAALIVFGGTLAATFLRSGWRESALALKGLRLACRRGYNAEQGKSELVGQVRAIREDGLLRAAPGHVGDCEFDEATDALIHDRSIAALLAAHEKHKARRMADADTAMRVVSQAAELAPVFGLAGTLVALNRMPADLAANGDAITGAIGMAVVTTLYGILSANLVLAPLARLIERAARAEEAQRQVVVDWLAEQVAEAIPQARAAPPHGLGNHGRAAA